MYVLKTKEELLENLDWFYNRNNSIRLILSTSLPNGAKLHFFLLNCLCTGGKTTSGIVDTPWEQKMELFGIVLESFIQKMEFLEFVVHILTSGFPLALYAKRNQLSECLKMY